MLAIYLEVAAKRAIAGAVEWPGWARSGKDEAQAITALLTAAPRYQAVLAARGIAFTPPADAAALVVAERIPGNSTTDFGVPGLAPAADARPVDEAELARLHDLLRAYWAAFDAAAARAQGKELRKGPRGGGRDLPKIVEHVVGAEQGYIGGMAYKWEKPKTDDPFALLEPTRQAVLDALSAAVHGETPSQRPRGGAVWPPRYFARRVGWHTLDHLWEIEDRLNHHA